MNLHRPSGFMSQWLQFNTNNIIIKAEHCFIRKYESSKQLADSTYHNSLRTPKNSICWINVFVCSKYLARSLAWMNRCCQLHEEWGCWVFSVCVGMLVMIVTFIILHPVHVVQTITVVSYLPPQFCILSTTFCQLAINIAFIRTLPLTWCVAIHLTSTIQDVMMMHLLCLSLGDILLNQAVAKMPSRFMTDTAHGTVHDNLELIVETPCKVISWVSWLRMQCMSFTGMTPLLVWWVVQQAVMLASVPSLPFMRDLSVWWTLRLVVGGTRHALVPVRLGVLVGFVTIHDGGWWQEKLLLMTTES